MAKQKCPKCGIVYRKGYSVAYDFTVPRPICPWCVENARISRGLAKIHREIQASYRRTMTTTIIEPLHCPKCGSTEITTKLHKKGTHWVCCTSEGEKRGPDVPCSLGNNEEHLHRTCDCGYEWDDKTLDAPKPIDDETLNELDDEYRAVFKEGSEATDGPDDCRTEEATKKIIDERDGTDLTPDLILVLERIATAVEKIAAFQDHVYDKDGGCDQCIRRFDAND